MERMALAIACSDKGDGNTACSLETASLTNVIAIYDSVFLFFFFFASLYL